jgi:hypothetical protein
LINIILPSSTVYFVVSFTVSHNDDTVFHSLHEIGVILGSKR